MESESVVYCSQIFVLNFWVEVETTVMKIFMVCSLINRQVNRCGLSARWKDIQQNGAKPRSHYLTQQWRRDKFSTFLDSDHWLSNTPDLNLSDDSI